VTDEEELIEDVIKAHNHLLFIFEYMREGAVENIKVVPCVLIHKEGKLVDKIDTSKL
jgi:hypothetical protein